MPEAQDRGLSRTFGRKLRSATIRKPILQIAMEVLLISVAVFLALMGEHWRERTQQRELARESIRHFRAEFAKNREAVAAVQEAHGTGLEAIQVYLNAADEDRRALDFPFESTNPAFLEYTA